MLRRLLAGSLLLALAGSGAGLLLQPSLRPRLPARLAASRARPRADATPLTSTEEAPAELAADRPPYTLTNLPRPIWRGKMMGWLHNTRLWYIIAVAYFLATIKLAPKPLPLLNVAVRAAAAAATSANIFISDGYHNADLRGNRRGSEAYDPDIETFWLRWDYVGISSILSTQYWLWAMNFGWLKRLQLGGWISGLALAGVCGMSRFVVPRKVGHTSVKLMMAVQFVGLLGYLVTAGCPVGCGFNMLIFAAYSPGLICYVLKKPKSAVFGFHEIFHTSVLLGHIASMAFDLRNLVLPCIAC